MVILVAWYAVLVAGVALWVFSPVPPKPVGCVDTCFGPALERFVVAVFTVFIAAAGVPIGLALVSRQTGRTPAMNPLLAASRAAAMSVLMAAAPLVAIGGCLLLIAVARS